MTIAVQGQRCATSWSESCYSIDSHDKKKKETVKERGGNVFEAASSGNRTGREGGQTEVLGWGGGGEMAVFEQLKKQTTKCFPFPMDCDLRNWRGQRGGYVSYR